MVRVLVVGGGGREHAIAWKLRQSPQLEDLWVAPGNGGTASIGENVAVPATDVEGLVRVAKDRRADLVFVGPDDPLALGIVDALDKEGILAMGPRKSAAQIEWSKTFAKGVMERAKVPTAAWRAFQDYAQARDYLSTRQVPVVIKADGLALGKGVAVCQTQKEAQAFLRSAMVERAFGDAGQSVVIEDYLTGLEASAFAFSDGTRVLPTVPACDYKRVRDGDQGPNTGGMGSYSPPEFLHERDLRWIRERVLHPVVRQLSAEGRPYRGILYAGLMLPPKGEPRVLEFNARMGDPETQAVLPRLESDLLSIAVAAASGSLEGVHMSWSRQACVAVVLASEGYPGEYRRGIPIYGLDELDESVLVFHAGTRLDPSLGRMVTNGGRVLTVAALGATIGKARDKVYANIARIRFEGMHYRKDIGRKALSHIKE